MTPSGEHDRYRLLAAGSIDGRISPDEARDLERHLAGCPDCRAELSGLLADHEWLSAPRSPVAPPADVRTSVLAAARSPRVPRTSDAAGPFLPAFLAAAALLVVSVLALNLVFAPSGPGAVPSRTPGPSASERVAPTPARSSAAGRACRTIPANVSARWTFDDPVERFTGAPTTLIGQARGVEGVQGGALELVGGTSEALVEDTSVGQLGPGDFTISTWVRFLDLGGEQVLLERFIDGDPSAGWTLTKLAEDEVRFVLGTVDGWLDVNSTGARLASGTWHHVAVRRLGRDVVVLLDGLEVGLASLPAGAIVNVAPDLPLRFGRRGDARGFHLNGQLDEVLLWSDRALTDTELADVRAAGAAGFCEAAAGAGYEGSWRAVDCAAKGSTLDCLRWGDGSELHLTIGPGEQPSATFEDESVDGCGANGAPGRRVAMATGSFEGAHLWLTFTDVMCTHASESWADPLGLYKPYGDADLWADPDGDGWGTVWRRA